MTALAGAWPAAAVLVAGMVCATVFFVALVIAADRGEKRLAVTGPADTYLVARDGRQWLVVYVPAEGAGAVVGRWDDRETADRECVRWIELDAPA